MDHKCIKFRVVALILISGAGLYIMTRKQLIHVFRLTYLERSDRHLLSQLVIYLMSRVGVGQVGQMNQISNSFRECNFGYQHFTLFH
jgi:hypothetical protein